TSMLATYVHPLSVMVAGAIGGIWYAFRQRGLQKEDVRPTSWDTQSVVLLVAVIASTFFLCKVGLQAASANSLRLRWSFVPPEEGAIYSAPVVVGHQVLVAAALQNDPSSGALYSLDRNTGELLWTFTNEGQMKQVLSSPCHADGRIYIGEGFHSDAPCKLYCISAADGEKFWDFETKSHTEATPNVVDGRVYFGAGDDGLYCLDSRTGEMIWHFEGPHVDGCPAIAHNRVYAGSGHENCEVFCVDATNGIPIWRVPVEVSSFAAATVSGKDVFFGIGNGNLVGSDINPSGALLCLDGKSGKIKWRYNVGDAVHSKPVVIGNQVVFVSRDHHCYCLHIKNGKLHWKRHLGAPALAAPVVAGVPISGGEDGLYVLAADGSLSCLNIVTGIPYSITYASGTSRLNANFIGTPAAAFTPSALGGHVQLHVGGSLSQFTTKPILLCFE
ncbi:MAG: PQQ-binding-like beta-propeller repeat protein, partial [Planctomycetota bacterium]